MNCEYCKMLTDLQLREDRGEHLADIAKRINDHILKCHTPFVTDSRITNTEGGTPL